MKTRRFIDQVTVHVRAGKGGDGSGSFRRESYVPFGGPDGGDGGRGGNVVFQASTNVNSLEALYFAPRLIAESGVDGRGQRMHGRAGKDLVVKVPCGTSVFDSESGELVADIVSAGKLVIIARGGTGGLGNVHFKSATHQAPVEFTPGTAGEEFKFRLELKSIAEAGLLGFPNAGKSSLLTSISQARPKIANYPFTTLNPIIGTIEYPDFSQIRVADVPGIVEGAAAGVGLGIAFLKHLSRARILVYVIDMAGSDQRQPWLDYLTLKQEIEQYDERLLERPCLVLANKMDKPTAAENLKQFVAETGIAPLEIVALDAQDTGILQFKRELWDLLQPKPRGHWPATTEVSEELVDTDVEVLPAEALAQAPFLDLNPKRSNQKRRKRRK